MNVQRQLLTVKINSKHFLIARVPMLSVACDRPYDSKHRNSMQGNTSGDVMVTRQSYTDYLMYCVLEFQKFTKFYKEIKQVFFMKNFGQFLVTVIVNSYITRYYNI